MNNENSRFVHDIPVHFQKDDFRIIVILSETTDHAWLKKMRVYTGVRQAHPPDKNAPTNLPQILNNGIWRGHVFSNSIHQYPGIDREDILRVAFHRVQVQLADGREICHQQTDADENIL
jgi:hypothetical protein